MASSSRLEQSQPAKKSWVDEGDNAEEALASDGCPSDIPFDDGSSSDDERAHRFQKVSFKGEEGAGYFMTFENYKFCYPNVKKRPKAKKLFNYNGRHGGVANMSVGEGDFRTKITKVTEDGVMNQRTVVKQRHLKDKSQYKKVWENLVNKQCAVRITSPAKLTNDPSSHIAYGLTKVPGADDDHEGFKSAAEEFWGGHFVDGADAPSLQDGWEFEEAAATVDADDIAQWRNQDDVSR